MRIITDVFMHRHCLISMRYRRISRSKFANQKTELDGITFDSKKEARRYAELKLLEKAGHISSLQRQVKYVLIPAQREPDTIGVKGGIYRGKVLEKECAYYADFVYMQDGKQVVEDVKSEATRTKEYIIKRKLMLYLYNIRVVEV